MRSGILRGRALWVLVGGLAVAVLISGGAVRRYWVRHRELNRLEDRLAEVRRKVRTLEARRARAENDAEFIETAARRELGLLASDEIEFRFVLKSSSATMTLNDKP
ncbi:MAG: septum formation initiator family protein [Elusimicrobia bacterium]|nr:septum formation initiator family protein [Elusimicrobiota bacterium]